MLRVGENIGISTAGTENTVFGNYIGPKLPDMAVYGVTVVTS